LGNDQSYGHVEEDFDLRRRQVLEHDLAADALSAEQLDGLACAYCGGRGGAMRLIGDGPEGQLFLHADPCFRTP
jgi:hypothetical protein